MLLVFLLSFNAQTAWAQDLTISSKEDWNTFAAAVNSGTSYSGQTVVLAADIKVSTMAGTDKNRFQGTFLGNGHKLTFNATVTEEYCAPFRFINGATIKCLKVADTITTDKKYASGIAGECSGTCTIQNCQSSIAIISTVKDDGTHGGFVSMQQDGILTISNCLFDGSFTGSETTNCGGFVGWRCNEGTLTFNNCLMAGSMSIIQNAESALFNRNGGSTLNNCYYFDDGNNNYGGITKQVSATDATDNDLQTLLGYGWQFNSTSVEPIMDDKNLATATISGISSSFFYTGKPYTVTYTVTAMDGSALSEGTDYTASITKDRNVSAVQDEGDYTLTITAKEDNGYTGAQTFDFTVISTPLGMSVDNEIAEGKVGHYYVNMPKEGTKKISIPEGFTSSLKVYDDGGSADEYSYMCNGYLVLTAPTGYVLQLSGNITTESWDYLTAYDGDDQNGTKLLDNVSGTTAISTVVSSGQNMTLYFNSDWGTNCAGLDLTVTLVQVIDGDSYANVTFTEPIENATVIFKRKFTQGVNSTLILPFGFTLNDVFKENYGNFYSLQTIRYNDADNQWEGWLENAVKDKVEANTPYVFVPSKTFNSITFTDVTIETTTPKDVTFGGENSNDWTFKGTYSQIENFETHDKPIYGFAGTNNSSIAVGEFVRANKEKVSIKPLRCYLEYNGSDERLRLSKSAAELPDHIVLRIIDSTIDPGDPTENPGSDITTPTSELNPAANVKVWSYDKTICIAAAPNTPYRIIDATGRILKDGVTATDRDEIRLGNHSGIAIVVINNKTFKVSY